MGSCFLCGAIVICYYGLIHNQTPKGITMAGNGGAKIKMPKIKKRPTSKKKVVKTSPKKRGQNKGRAA
jgi:hypothetical protein